MPGLPPPKRVAPSHPWVILLVDDEDDILEAIQGLLEEKIEGVKVVTASSGRDALDILARERIDLIMSDFKMPGMDGIEFLFQARRSHPNVPRVMFTAYNSEELARRAIVETMVSSFLLKTSTPEKLLDQVTALLNYEPASSAPSPPPAARDMPHAATVEPHPVESSS